MQLASWNFTRTLYPWKLEKMPNFDFLRFCVFARRANIVKFRAKIAEIIFFSTENHISAIFWDIDLKFEIWIDNCLRFPKLLARFFDFGLERADFGTWTSYTKFSEKILVKILSKRVKIGEKVRFRQIFFIWWLKRLENTLHAKFELFITFRYPQNGHFYHAFLRKSKKFGRNWVKKGSKQVKKGGEAQNYWIHG